MARGTELLIDIHCHILPRVDDGPDDVAAAVDLVTGLERLGFGELYPTPHQKAGSFQPTDEDIRRAAQMLGVGLQQVRCGVTVHPAAAENMWDEVLLARRAGGIPTYPGGRALLLEFPAGSVPEPAGEALFQLRMGGLLPVLAHVERYPLTLRDPSKAEGLARVAALLVNLPTLGGASGWTAQRLARRLVKSGVIHALATDAHSTDDLPSIASGLRWLHSTLGDEISNRLLRDGPRRIIAGELPEW